MHLLQVQAGEISDGTSPVDLGQTPAEIVVISAADTEIAALSAAREGAGETSLRLASLLNLGHNFTVDKYLDDTASHARLVVVRVLGGRAYWPYGVEQFAIRLAGAGIGLALLPGDDKPDPDLRSLSNIPNADYDALWSYLTEGGPENATNFLRYARAMVAGSARPQPARPLLRAGLYFPGLDSPDLASLRQHWQPDAPVVAVVFYRALVQGAGLHPINRLIKALLAKGMNPLPVYVASLKDAVSAATLAGLMEDAPPALVLNATSFAISTPGAFAGTVLDAPGAPVFQIVFAGGTEAGWEAGTSGLSARDIAMNVSLPELDGRILTRALSFKGEAYFDAATECLISTYRAHGERIGFVAELAANWARLRTTPPAEKRVALVLANYPNKDGRLANGVGLDTPAATVDFLATLAENGYRVHNPPATSAELMAQITAGPTNWLTDRAQRSGGVRLTLAEYHLDWGQLPAEMRQKVTERWGLPEADPFFKQGEVDCGAFALSVFEFGNVVIGVQPARGYNIDPTDSYHSPDLVPPHNYLAFYFWLRNAFRANAIVHMGKHGNLEWLPGKALALSNQCFPEAALGPTPHFYPFIVNDPGEGTQAKRRAQTVIIDHLTPPLTRAENYGALKDLEALVDEYYEAAGVDARRTALLRREILSLTATTELDKDAGLTDGDDDEARLQKLDAYLCDLKESQIRDGLHIFGRAPEGRLARDLAAALVRLPRGDGKGRNASLLRALAVDLGLNDTQVPSYSGLPQAFDPLDCQMSAPWTGPRPIEMRPLSDDPWRTAGDTVERLELLAARLIAGAKAPGPASAAVMEEVNSRVAPDIAACGPAERGALLTGLAGQFVTPGPSGAPSRGRLDVLPTGRNFYSIDSRTLPTPTAWTLGWKSATQLLERHLQDAGDHLRSAVITAWGTSNMRTGGDDIAQALALMGARPKWDEASRRVTGFEIIPASVLDRPRVDVTLRISGFFRDAFPAQIDLVDSAARAIMALDEPEDINPAAARFRAEAARHGEDRAGIRVFGAKPGAYGAGLQALIDERIWNSRADLGAAYLEWGGYAYGAGAEGPRARDMLEARLGRAEAVIQNQDNREHDLLDSDDYYQFEGGAAAAIESLRGIAPTVYHADHSRPERPVIRTLDEEIGRVMRSRVVNPKWIDGVKRHGYKGAFEMAATLDYLFAFAATTRAVKNHHFDMIHAAYLEDEATRDFIAEANPAALREMADRLAEAIERGLWVPKSNSARGLIDRLRA
ncbi:cobaltochelatase subunit CobN [Abyssibius alkaniclasticus]|uniref:cobaltochelatase subunit CobN n=1 Tax=Abyssibius alkaniclasticus TaxID=2881234 RepID=UPI00236337CE|nr:cobaltochelatase subunit CobN [Abyssibius alkaniclasticus]UPH72324.1 cobaltochelatase subunit CobN [Abyssibius alkaniclasticus]